MLLTDSQRDALTEVVNIGFGRAAATLSELTGQRVLIQVPQIEIQDVHGLGKALDRLVQGEVATVHQIFSGPIAGDALLLLNYDSAIALSALLSTDRQAGARLDAADREVLTEVGNILINACLGTFSNMLDVRISFSVPRLHVDALRGLLDSLVIERIEVQHVLIIYATFRLQESLIDGYILIALGVSSLDRLLQALADLG